MEAKKCDLELSSILVAATAQHATSPIQSRIDIPPASESWKDPGVKGKTHRARRTIQLYIWDEPDKPAKEEHFLFKLDFFVLSYACLGYFCKSLDQANINNAYVSGMKEAINMQGSQLTYVRNAFTVGYVLSDIPAVILVTKIRPSILIPTLEPGFIAAATSGVAVILVSNLARILEGRDSKITELALSRAVDTELLCKSRPAMHIAVSSITTLYRTP
ncbi:uncharacterized protein L3040_009591 [Drepanopeziza brunnea f. sp. 'multigermtubi']|uniref:uncharacterized protein n=1 Tax=Drepanopeziza brunnea f. sp. 'multigermtubi' TaxID=698441 RepID=UPI0023A16889|nr:hypothetical protein L3040_009591 [Drepanopeziza brunnea f. sp. 'multigermtubi']